MLSYEKYTGAVRLFDSESRDIQYLSSDNHPTIISTETFNAVQLEKVKRSNVIKDENGKKRKDKKYSSKTQEEAN